MRLVGERRRHAEVADRLGEPDRERRPDRRGEDRRDQPDRLDPAGAVDAGGVLELLAEPGERGGDREERERDAAQAEQQHDAERAEDRVGDERQVEPDPVHDAVDLDQPHPAERRQPRGQQQHEPHAAGDQPPAGSVVRPPARRSGSPSASPSAAAAQLTQIELTSATAVAPLSASEVGEREPLRALVEQARRDGQHQEAGAGRQDEEGDQEPEDRHAEPRATNPAARHARRARRARRERGPARPRPGVSPAGGALASRGQRTMVLSNQLLIVGSRGPQV